MVYGKTLFAMAVRSVIGGDEWEIEGGYLVNASRDTFIPVFDTGVSEEDAAADDFGCYISVGGDLYSPCTSYLHDDTDGGTREIRF